MKNIHSNNNESDCLLSLDSMNQRIRTMEYAVRGAIPIRATELEKELKSGVKKPFDEVIRANIGDCHAMNQQPLTFFRQVLSGVLSPTQCLSNPDIPEDVKQRVTLLLDGLGGRSVGAYSDASGVEIIRRHVAEYIEERDGIPSDWLNIVLTTGASEGAKAMLSFINSGSTDGIPTELEKELKSGVKKPFDEVIRANIGDCHAMNQQPLTFFRQVLSGVLSPTQCLSNPDIPEDVKQRVTLLLDGLGGRSVGAYSDASGVEIIRRHVAEYIEERDGIPSDWLNVVLTTGASEGAKAMLSFINSGSTDGIPTVSIIFGYHFLTTGASEGAKAMLSFINSGSTDGIPTGVMVPIPQYPLYSATICELGMHLISYYLDEQNEWALNIDELSRAYEESKSHCKPKAIVVINPGNPTGSVLTRHNIEDIIRFAKQNNLIIIADEVYQHNIWKNGAKFYSFKKVMHELGIRLELVSMMSASKGFMGECGLRGGYLEISNFDAQVKAMFLKMLSARLCSSILGQIAMDCVVKPPAIGSPSYETFIKEKEEVLESLRLRAKLTADTFNSIPGIVSNPVAGAMYAFPRIVLPEKAIKAAEERGQKADFFYAMTLLEKAGICVVPGSGFGQIPGTYHFRTTILPQIDKLEKMMK
ncbi:unnamed protein product, partial [Medioppia subpectinata]